MRNSFIVPLVVFLMSSLNLAHAAPHGFYPVLSNQITPNNSLRVGGGDIKVAYYGGPVISNAKVYVVFWDANVSSSIQSQIGDFYATTLNSTFMDWLKEYDTTNVQAVNGHAGTNQAIGRGSYQGEITLKPTHTGATLDDKDIEAELEAQVANHTLPTPDESTLFMIYFPKGVKISAFGAGSCKNFCAYHEGFMSKTYGNIYYGVMPDISGMCRLGCGFHFNSFDTITSVSSHELTEAITDPLPTEGNKPDYPQAWNTDNASEIGDVCQGSSAHVISQKGHKYLLQGEFDKSMGGCKMDTFQSP